MTSLRALGWDDAWQRARADLGEGTRTIVRITAEHRGAYFATNEQGSGWVELRGRAFHRADDKRALPTVGDWALVDRWDSAQRGDGAATLHALLPRRSLLVRKAAGEATLPQPLAANIDLGVIVTSANLDLSLARLDRYLALLRDAGIAPALVLSKLDLAADAGAALARLTAVAGGAPVLGVSAHTGVGIEALRGLVATGRTAILLGSSGVGKSTLLNAMVGEPAQRTQDLRDDQRGRHTTTRRELFVTANGVWIDTPGMRELGQWIADDDAAAPNALVAEVEQLATDCRFRDCTHRDEPGCAVRGAIAADRLASYHKLIAERAAAHGRQRGAARLASTRKAKAKKR